MWAYLNDCLTKTLDKTCGWLGRYTPEQCTQINRQMAYRIDELEAQNQGLLYSVGELDRRHKDSVLIMTALFALSGEEEKLIKTDYIHELFQQGYTLDAQNDANGDIQLKLVVLPQNENINEDDICDDCGGVIE